MFILKSNKSRKVVTRTASLILAAAMVLPIFSSCGKDDSSSPKTTLKIMCWSESFRDVMETYFIPNHEDLMNNVEIEWMTDEIVNYPNTVEKRLDSGEQIDLFLGNDKMTARFANNDKVASLSELGISDDELSKQYQYTRVMASDANGVQKGSAINAEPGIIIYRADYAEKYLGITHQDEMQELLSSWDTFLSVAQKLNEKTNGEIKMLTGSSEIWKPIDGAMTGLWTSEGRLSTSDETITRWLNYIKNLDSANAFLDTASMSDDWYNGVNSGVFCFFSAPWLNKDIPLENADTNTIFSTAKRNGESFGKWKVSLAPNGFTYGGNWLFSSANSKNKQLVSEIIREFTCDSEFMKMLALGNMEYVNNTEVIAELSEENIPNPLFNGVNAFSIYNEAARGLEFSTPSVYDSDISRLLYNQTTDYCDDKITIEKAIYNFHLNVWKKYSDITEKPAAVK